MKYERNIELMREILLWAESQDDSKRPEVDHEHAEFIIGRQIDLLIQAGLIEKCLIMSEPLGEFEIGKPPPRHEPVLKGPIGKLTYAGCEFVDNFRGDTMWQKSKEFFSKASIPLSVVALQTIIKTQIPS